MTSPAGAPAFDDVVAEIAARAPSGRLRVAIDGGDGSGKTTLAARLAAAIDDAGRSSQVIHVDDFMHGPAVRHRRGRNSPEGYLDDSYDYGALRRNVQRPTPAGTVVIVEGLFLLRDELVDWWDCSIFLDVEIEVALRRKAARDGVSLGESDALTMRYVEGQRLYRERCRPRERATWVLTDQESRSSTPAPRLAWRHGHHH
ncbi:uridine kinase [Nocardioides speluncae]|uniref:uridine kinase n=1 Tax=Nocardioides speluncae TaxID=2670337 RepID=UPI001980FF03|nr:uridine kinase [Nocardioides speluncae]